MAVSSHCYIKVYYQGFREKSEQLFLASHFIHKQNVPEQHILVFGLTTLRGQQEPGAAVGQGQQEQSRSCAEWRWEQTEGEIRSLGVILGCRAESCAQIPEAQPAALCWLD